MRYVDDKSPMYFLNIFQFLLTPSFVLINYSSFTLTNIYFHFKVVFFLSLTMKTSCTTPWSVFVTILQMNIKLFYLLLMRFGNIHILFLDQKNIKNICLSQEENVDYFLKYWISRYFSPWFWTIKKGRWWLKPFQWTDNQTCFLINVIYSETFSRETVECMYNITIINWNLGYIAFFMHQTVASADIQCSFLT